MLTDIMAAPILEVKNIKVKYSGLPVLQKVSLSVNPGETVCVVGANGASKSTLLRAIMGTQRTFEGQILFSGREIQRLRTEEIVRLGIVYVPEEKMLFRPLPVEENLLLGAYILKDPQRVEENLDLVYTLFPRLRERRLQPASTLSGGVRRHRGRIAMSRHDEVTMTGETMTIIDRAGANETRRPRWGSHRRGHEGSVLVLR